MLRSIPIGVDDFRALREGQMEYIDKSTLIVDLLNKGASAFLFPRPRRFGKTLNMTMLRAFFEKSSINLSHLFSDLAVWNAGEKYQTHFQRYPVLFLTLKDAKFADFESTFSFIRLKLAALFEEHRAVLQSGLLSSAEIDRYHRILHGTADSATCANALLDLSTFLHRYHQERVVILVDEYDAPIHAGYAGNYAPQILDFLRAFLSAALKGNPHLFKAVLTGILRVAKESIFSGLNHLAVYSLLRPEFGDAFGFTEREVEALLIGAGRADALPAVRDYYNGYHFGGVDIYNPWSILNFLDDQEGLLRPHWVTTSSNDLVRVALHNHALAVEPQLRALLAGESIQSTVNEDVVLTDLDNNAESLWSLLVFSGYLRAEQPKTTSRELQPYHLSIPNREVRQVYTSTFREWMSAKLGGTQAVGRLKTALLSGDAETLEQELTTFVTSVLSYHDLAAQPERVYHAFVLGLLAALEPGHEVRSNRESGTGRPDVIIRPKEPGAPGAVLELKVAKPGRKTLEQALAEAVLQIQERNYAADLLAAGARPVFAFAIAFDGKKVRVTSVCPQSGALS